MRISGSGAFGVMSSKLGVSFPGPLAHTELS